MLRNFLQEAFKAILSPQLPRFLSHLIAVIARTLRKVLISPKANWTLTRPLVYIINTHDLVVHSRLVA